MPLEAIASVVDDDSAVYLRSMDGKFVFCNTVFYTMAGKTREQILGKTSQEVFGYGVEMSGLQSIDALVIASGAPTITEETKGTLSYKVLKTLIVGHDGQRYLVGVATLINPTTAVAEDRIAHMRLRLLEHISQENIANLADPNHENVAMNRLSVPEQEPIVAAIDRFTSRANVLLSTSIQTQTDLRRVYRIAVIASSAIALLMVFVLIIFAVDVFGA